MATRITLTDIAPASWEHPADRAALNALRAIPGFDHVVRKIAAFFGERGLRQLFLANAVRVGPRQRPELDALLTEILETMDWAERPQLYVTQAPMVNAAALGFDKPFIVINSGTLEHLDRDEQKVLIAHEVGHIMSGHVLYRTVATILMTFGIGALPFLAAAVIFPFQMAFLEWYRKSELSSDRASLLAVQDRRAVMMTFLKVAGGPAFGHTIDLDAFMEQAAEYETQGDAWDKVLQVLNTVFREHPFNTVRAGELQRYIDAGRYDKVLAGEYERRSDARPSAEEVGRDFSDAGAYYGEQAKQAAAKAGEMLGRAKDAFTDAFKTGSR
jgi:Zn-dependent protease with chaperone function